MNDAVLLIIAFIAILISLILLYKYIKRGQINDTFIPYEPINHSPPINHSINEVINTDEKLPPHWSTYFDQKRKILYEYGYWSNSIYTTYFY